MNRLAVVRALMVVAAALSAPALAHAQQQQYGQPPNTYVTWGAPGPQARFDVTYFIDAGFSAAQANLIRQAAAAWNNASSAINLVEAGPGADIQFNYVALGGPTLSQMTMNTTPGPGTYPNGSPWAQIVGPVIVDVNSAAPWNTTGAAVPFTFDFTAYSMTIMGRAIGLGTAGAGDLPSVMVPDSSFNFGTTGQQTPSASDVAAINAVYGTPEPATLALFGLGLGVLGFSKRLRRR